jgi:flavodoxin
MKALVIYDSQFGNTKKIAQAIAEGLSSEGEVEARHIRDVQADELRGLGVLILGSPTQRFRPTERTKEFIKAIERDVLSNTKVAAFDTRLTEEEIEKTGILAFFVRIFGYAAKPIGDRLVKKGGILILPPEGFCVDGIEGPLLEGELDRARSWGEEINHAVQR